MPGKKDLFPNEDGLVEGKVAVIAQPISGATVELLELEIDEV